MSVAVRHPPGRGGRLWLQRRLATAQRAAGLLDVKLRILRSEQEQRAALVVTTAAAWRDACAEARTWHLRALAVGGRRALRPATDGTAQVSVGWGSVMGVRHPTTATCVFPPPSPDVYATAAVPMAAAAFRAAAQAGVEHAVAQAAAEVLAVEIASTRSRLRAIEEQWVPGLEQALRALELSLDEQERADGLRLRWAGAHRRERPCS